MKTILISYHASKDNLPAVKAVQSALKKYSVSRCDRTKLSKKIIQGKDLVISIGGDGTFLRTSHFVKDVPMLGVNSNPEQKEGFLMETSIKDFNRAMAKIEAAQYIILPMMRLEAIINKRKIHELALNDIFIGCAKSYKLCNYEITIRENTEYQRSSGIIVATPVGTHSWIKSAGGKVLDFESPDCDQFEYLVREPYVGTLNNNPGFVNSVLKRGDIIRIKSCSYDMVVVFDSVGHEHKVHKGDIIQIFVSDECLNYIKLQ